MRKSIQRTAVAIAFAFAATAAHAHAQLVKATPAVGATVASRDRDSPEIQRGRRAALLPHCADRGRRRGSAARRGQSRSRRQQRCSSPIGKPLPPGVYTVTWSAVSVDTHHTQGDFQFTVKP
jgi:methionine-rich copper-binding protein CopC